MAIAPIARVSKLGFEIETCSRCGGTGNYSYCQSYGTRCFKCRGNKVTLTKRGAAAAHFYNERLMVRADTVKIGDIIRVESVTMAGDTFAYWAPVTEINNVVQRHGKTEAGVTTWYETPMLEIVTVSEKASFGRCAIWTLAASPIRPRLTGEQKQPHLDAALAYQATLTKTGKPPKSKEAAA